MNGDPTQPAREAYAAVVSVGPGDRDLQRLAELVSSLMRFDGANLRRLILVDDVAVARDLTRIAQLLPTGCLRVLHNPRRSRGDAWSGGLTANTVFGMAAAVEESGCAYTLKLDTDSLAIAPFHERLTRFFQADARCGVAGSCYDMDLHGQPTADSTWVVNLAKWRRPLRLRRNPFPRLEQGVFGINGQIRRLISTALEVGVPAGYRLGICAQGGGYAVRRETLVDLRERNWLVGEWWSRVDLTEDVVISMLATAAGWHVRDYNQPGQVFGVQYRRLGFSPDELRARGYGIIHSLKCADWESELALRTQFHPPQNL